jgi:hypothetical protein
LRKPELIASEKVMVLPPVFVLSRCSSQSAFGHAPVARRAAI